MNALEQLKDKVVDALRPPENEINDEWLVGYDTAMQEVYKWIKELENAT